jgi:hypothetical protein
VFNKNQLTTLIFNKPAWFSNYYFEANSVQLQLLTSLFFYSSLSMNMIINMYICTTLHSPTSKSNIPSWPANNRPLHWSSCSSFTMGTFRRILKVHLCEICSGLNWFCQTNPRLGPWLFTQNCRDFQTYGHFMLGSNTHHSFCYTYSVVHWANTVSTEKKCPRVCSIPHTDSKADSIFE